VQALGGAPEVALLGDRDEGPEVAELHRSEPRLIHIRRLLNRSTIGVVAIRPGA
jgi:hypothetical protein